MKKTLQIASMMLLTSTAMPAWAQEASDNSSIDEIVVTAQRREERLQSVPISITAFDQESLEERDVKELPDLARFTPGLTIDAGARTSGASSASSIYIRGVGQSDFFASAEPGVGIYIDGVYFGRTQGSILDVLDVSRVEVLRGPQGTLFGRNTIGGAISVISAEPDSVFGGSVSGSLGRFDQRDFRLSVTGPLAEGFDARLAVSSRNRKGYAHSEISGQSFGDTDSQSARLSFLITPASNVTLTIAADITSQREAGRFQQLVAVDTSTQVLSLYNPLVAEPTGLGPLDETWIRSGYTNSSVGDDYSNLDTYGVSATLDWQLSDSIGLTSISAYRRLKSDSVSDSDGTPFPFTSTDLNVDQDQFSQELRLGGTAGTRLNWMVGGYFFQEDVREDLVQLLFSGLYNALEAYPGRFGPTPFGGAGNPYNAYLDADVEQQFIHDNQSWAGFGQATYSLNDVLDLTIGLRYTEEDKVVVAQSRLINTNQTILPAGTTLPMHWSAFTPKASIEFQPTEAFLAYASLAKGFKSGGVNPRPQSLDEFTAYDPEEVLTYEVGIKSDWLNRRLRINAATYLSDYSNLQFLYRIAAGESSACPATQTAGCHVAANATKAKIWGAEAEITAKPVDGLDLFAGLNWTRNEFTEVDPLLIASGQISTQTKLPKTPEWTINVGAQYSVTLDSDWQFTVRGDYAWRGAAFNDFENTAVVAQPGYGLLSGRIAIVVPGGDWDFSLSGENLTDEYYYTGGVSNLDSLGVAVVGVAPPRTWTLSVRHRFGGQ